MNSFWNSLYKMFFIFAVLSGLVSYINIDPMKSSFFLIFSLLFSMPILSMSMHTWFSYFVCLLFLSGIFVILVYFSSLSKVNLTKSYLPILVFLFSIIMIPTFVYNSDYLNLSGFYYSIYWVLFVYILLMLIFFMNFSSYFLNFSGALRKV